MPAPQRVTTEAIVEAYRSTGSVWKAGKQLGIVGQSVWERLHAIGYPLARRTWTNEELAELRHLAGTCPISEIAQRLGRPYGGIATKISQLGLAGQGRTKQLAIKIPRGAGYDKESIHRRLRALAVYDGSLRQFCRANGLAIEPFVQAIQKHFPDEWDEYARTHTDLEVAQCPSCGRDFYPMTQKQKTCSRLCSAHLRADAAYFGGRRQEAIGMRAGICQLCGREGRKGLAAHHVFGKENDPENDVMVALCNGCHQLVSHLAARRFIEDPAVLEGLIGLAIVRRRGDKGHRNNVWVSVDIEHLTDEDEETWAQ